MRESVEQKRALIVVVTEWVLFLIGIILLVVLWDRFSQNITQVSYGPITQKEIVEAILVGYGGLFLLTLLLTCGVKKRCSFFCKIWYLISTIFILIQLFAFMVTLSFVVFGLPFWGWYNLIGCSIVAVKALLLSYRVFAVYTIIDFTELLRIYPVVSKNVNNDTDTHNTYRESIL